MSVVLTADTAGFSKSHKPKPTKRKDEQAKIHPALLSLNFVNDF